MATYIVIAVLVTLVGFWYSVRAMRRKHLGCLKIGGLEQQDIDDELPGLLFIAIVVGITWPLALPVFVCGKIFLKIWDLVSNWIIR